MSREIDEKVVSIDFDNERFERKTAQTMGTLEKLKRSLNFDGATKGLDEIEKSSKRMDFSPMAAAVEKVTHKFSALEIAGITTISRLTNRTIDMGENLVKSLSIDQVTAGWSKYAEKTSAVQTIMAATSKQFSDTSEQMDYVNEQLEKLNWYTDETSYNLLDMTSNIGKFTSNNVDLDTSVTAMQGIANWAAISGANAGEASRAMYNLSQALATGAVKLIDWKSIENANMATAEFKEIALETAAALGTLTKSADGTFKTIEKGNEVSVSNFNAALQDGWFTSEVLLGTLDKYGGFTNKLNEAYVKMGDGVNYTTSEILDLIDAFKEDEKVAEEVAKKTKLDVQDVSAMLTELGKDEYELGRRAFRAGQEAKTFAEAISSVKDAVSTGWMKSFELIFGDYDKARKVWTGFANWLYEVFAEMGNFRNAILESALGKSFTGVAKVISGITEPAKEAAKSVSNIIESMEELNALADKVIYGSFGNGAARFNALTEAGYNYYQVQNKVNEKMGCAFRYSEDQIKSQEKLSEVTEKQAEINKENLKSLVSKNEADLRDMNLTEEQIEAIKQLQREADKLGISTDKFIDNIDELNGRWILLDSFKNIGDSLLAVLELVQTAWREVIYGTSDEEKVLEKRSENIYNLIAGFHKLTEALKITSKNMDKPDTKANKLYRTFKGLFALVSGISNLLFKPLKIGFEVLKGVLSYLNIDLLDFTATIGDYLVEFKKWSDSFINISGAVETAMPHVMNFIHKIEEWYGVIKKWVKGLNEAENKATYIAGSVSKWGETIKNALSDVYNTISSKLSGSVAIDCLKGFINGFEEYAKPIIDKIMDIGENIIEKFKDVLGVHSPSWKFFEIAVDCIRGAIEGFESMIPKVVGTVKGIAGKILEALKEIDYGKLVSLAITGTAIAALVKVGKTADKLVTALDVLSGPIKGINGILTAVQSGVSSMFSAINTVILGLDKLTKATSNKINSEAFKNIATSILMLTGALIALAIANEKYDLLPAVQMMIAMVGAITILSAVIGAFGGKAQIDFGKFAAMLLSLAAVMLAFVRVAKKITKFSWSDLGKAGAGMAGMIVLIAGLIASTRLYTEKDVKKLTATLLGVSVAMGILAGVARQIARMEWSELGKAGAGMAGLVVLITGLVAATNLFAKDTKGLAVTLMGIAIAMGLMTGVIKQMARLVSGGDLKKAAVGMIALGAFMTALIWATKLAQGQMKGVGATIAAVGGAMIALTMTVRILKELEWEEFWKGVKMMAVLELMIVGLVAATRLGASQIKGVASTLFMASFAISILAGMAAILGLIDPKNLYAGVGAIAILGLMMAVLIASTKGLDGPNARKALVRLAIIVASLAALATVISLIKDTKGLARSVQSLTALMIGLSALALAVGVMEMYMNLSGSPIKAIATLTSVALMALGIVELMSLMKTDVAIKNAGSLAIVLEALASVAVILSKYGGEIDMSVKDIGKLFLFAMSAWAIMALISALKMDASLKNVAGFVVLINGLSAAALILSKIGPMGTVAAEGAAALLTVVGIASAIVLALGIIAAAIPGSASFIEEVGDCLEAIGSALGRFVGGFVGGAVGGSIASTLDEIGPSLETFAGHLAAIPKIDLGNVSSLALCIAEFEAVSVLNGFANLITIGNKDKKLNKSLSAFGEGIKAFAASVSGIGDSDIKAMDAAADAGLAIAKLQSNLPRSGGLFQAIAGWKNLGKFGTNLEKFGEGIKMFSRSVDHKVNKEQIQNAIEAIQPLVDMQNSMKSFGGLIDVITGWSDLGTFGVNLEMYGQSLVRFSNSITGAGLFGNGIDAEAILNAANASKALADFAAAVPETGGLKSIFTGDEDLDAFGESIVDYAHHLGLFGQALSNNKIDIDPAEVQSLIDISVMLASFQSSLEPIGGMITWFEGRDDLGTFGQNAASFVEQLAYLNNYCSWTTWDLDSVATALSIAMALGELQDGLDKVGGVVSWFTGWDDLSTFGDHIVEFVESLIKYNDALANVEWNKENLSMAFYVADSLAQLANKLEPIGGMITWFEGKSDLGKFADNLVDFGEGMVEYGNSLEGLDTSNMDKALSAAQSVIDFASSIGEDSASSLASLSKSLKKLGKNGVKAFIEAFTSSKDDVADAGKALADGIAQGIEDESETVSETAETMAKDAAQATRNTGKFGAAGEFCAQGYALGISRNAYMAVNAAKQMALAAVAAVESVNRQGSPAKEYIKMANFAVQGYAIGFTRYSRIAEDSAAGMAKNTMQKISSIASGIGSYFTDDIDMSPTISPVVDLTNVKNGVGQISNLFGGSPIVGVSASLRDINRNMSGRQNGNDDVVDAVNRLNKKLDSVGGTYNYTTIDGISYNDQDNINDAVGELVRAVRIEGRS